MTETLSTLDRNQLQKLLQYAVQEDPAGILGKVFKHLGKLKFSIRNNSIKIIVYSQWAAICTSLSLHTVRILQTKFATWAQT